MQVMVYSYTWFQFRPSGGARLRCGDARRGGAIKMRAQPVLQHEQCPDSMRVIVTPGAMLIEHARDRGRAKQAPIQERRAAQRCGNALAQRSRLPQPVLERHRVTEFVLT